MKHRHPSILSKRLPLALLFLVAILPLRPLAAQSFGPLADPTTPSTPAKKNDHGDIIKSIGKCGKATYDAVSGDVTMEDWPQIQQGINNQVATQQSTVMILNAKGRSRTIGGSRTMIVDQGQTDKAVTP